MLPVRLFRIHAGDNPRVLRLERAHVALRRLDRVLLGELVAVVRPLQLLLLLPLRHLLLVVADLRGRILILGAVAVDGLERLLHLLLLRLLERDATRAEQLLLLLLEPPPLLALRPRHVRLRVVAVGRGARRRQRAGADRSGAKGERGRHGWSREGGLSGHEPKRARKMASVQGENKSWKSWPP